MNIVLRLLNYGFDYIRTYSSLAILIIGSLLFYLFISIEYWSIVGPILGVTVGAGVATGWCFIRKTYNTGSHTRPQESPLPIQIPFILSSHFAVIILIGTRFYLHQRPNWFYLAFAGYAALIAYQIARSGNYWRIVPQIAVLAFFTYWSSQLLFPAGMYNPDTHYSYIPSIYKIYATGTIPESETIYAGHLAMASEFSIVTGLSVQKGYFLVSTLILVCTIPIIATVDRVLPPLSKKIALYAALVFAISSWIIRRGMHPNKLNFFYPLILLLGLTTIQVYRSGAFSRLVTRRWVILGIIIMPALVFGHQFSAGATMVFLLTIGAFVIAVRLLPNEAYNIESRGVVLPFIIVYTLSIIGNPIHQEALLRRFSGILLAIVQSGNPTGGPGSYSALPLNVLIASTAAQTLLFTLAILGAIWLFQQDKWEYDLIIFWLGSLSILLIVSLSQNSADTQPQRFYSLLILFGFNICVGAFLSLIDHRGKIFQNRQINLISGRLGVVILIGILAMASLASPIADTATSPVVDDNPHFRKFDTVQRINGNQWTQRYTTGTKRIVGPSSDVPIEQTGPNTGIANFSSINKGTIYAYSKLANRTGVMTNVGLSLGGRTYVFVPSPKKSTDSQIYTNGETSVYLQHSLM